jgi:hypothetical protein
MRRREFITLVAAQHPPDFPHGQRQAAAADAGSLLRRKSFAPRTIFPGRGRPLFFRMALDIHTQSV